MELWDKSSEVLTSGTNKKVKDRRPDEKNKIRKGKQMCPCKTPLIAGNSFGTISSEINI